MQTLTSERAIVVFGTQWDKEARKFPDFVYRELDKAVAFLLRGIADHIIVCGSHLMKGILQPPPPEEREAFKMRRYIFERYGHLGQFARKGVVLIEDQSTSIPDNWARLKQCYPSLEAINLITVLPLLPRVRFFGDMVYDNGIAVTYTALPAAASGFRGEARILAENRCLVRQMTPGGYRIFLDEDGNSLWPVIRQQHHEACLVHWHLHHPVAAFEGS